MAVDLQNNAEYRTAQAEFEAARKVAQASNDETGLLRAELAFNKRESAIRDSVLSDQERASTIDLMQTEFPLVPKVVYEHLADPAKIREAAKQVSDQLAASMQGNWGQPGGPQGQPAAKKATWRDPDLRRRVNTGNNDHAAMREWKASFMEDRILPAVERLSGAR